MSNSKTLVVLEPPLRDVVEEIAHSNHVSISSICRDLIREALETYEDRYWERLASEREKGFNWKKGISHKKAWRIK